MAENQNGINASTPKLQKRFAAARTNRRRRHIGYALNFIVLILLVLGGTVGGLWGELCLISAFVILPIGGYFLSKKEATHV